MPTVFNFLQRQGAASPTPARALPLWHWVCGLMLGGLLLGPAAASDYPERPIRIILGYSTGGTADNLGRALAERMAEKLGQAVVFENRPGASGSIAAQAVAKANPDGYTVLFGNTAEMAINKHLMDNLGFDPDVDFKPVVRIHNVPLALLTANDSEFDSLETLLATARNNPGAVSFANPGNGSPGHLAGEMLATSQGIDMIAVPYKGAAPAMVDLLGGRVDAFFLGLPGALPHANGGSVRMLALSTQERSGLAPEVPTVHEVTGTEGFDFSLWGGFFVPADTPDDVVVLLNQTVNELLGDPQVIEQMREQGAEAMQNSPEEFARFVQEQSEKYGELLGGRAGR